MLKESWILDNFYIRMISSFFYSVHCVKVSKNNWGILVGSQIEQNLQYISIQS